MRDELIELALSRHGPRPPDARAVADTTVRALSAVLDELKPLVGDMAARALYLRSLHLADISFHGPASPDTQAQSALVDALRADLASRDMQEARRHGRALLQSLANLLASLIGENLTHRMLSTAWGVPTPAPGHEDEPT